MDIPISLIISSAFGSQILSSYSSKSLACPEVYRNASASTAFILLLLCLVPGIIYIVYKCKQKQKYREMSAEFLLKKLELENKMEDICSKSRALSYIN